MLTTKQLVDWALEAQDKRESSWHGSRYELTISDAVKVTKPEQASKVESEIVEIFNYQAWNEVQIWKEMLDKTI